MENRGGELESAARRVPGRGAVVSTGVAASGDTTRSMGSSWLCKHPLLVLIALTWTPSHPLYRRQICYRHIPRELNKMADQLANVAMDTRKGVGPHFVPASCT
jgi:hypothetical protein